MSGVTEQIADRERAVALPQPERTGEQGTEEQRVRHSHPRPPTVPLVRHLGAVVARDELFGEHLELPSELLRVAGGLAAFSGFYFAIAIFTDSTYRQEFLAELTAEMRASFRDRSEYCKLRSQP